MLDESTKMMTLPVLKKIEELVNAGAKIAGFKPQQSPGLIDDETEFNNLVSKIWNSVGVSETKNYADVLKTNGVREDVVIKNNHAEILYVHRSNVKINAAETADIYWLNNRGDNEENIDVTFRIGNKIPELWFAETGKTEALSYEIDNGVTTVKVHLESRDAVFIVFRNKAAKNNSNVLQPAVKTKELAIVPGAWNVSFQKERGAPANAVFNELTSFSNNTDAGIKYFSGTATYTKSITVPAAWFIKNTELWLNLGDVKNIAEVTINGKPAGVVWKKPFRVNVTSSLKPGNNTIEIHVTNLWVNRIIGDAQPDVKNKITFTTMPFYGADAKLLESGLMRPVKILSKTK